MFHPKLIEAVESGEGTDRELDARIATSSGWRLRERDSGEIEWISPTKKPRKLPNFTGLIDHALTLIPPDYRLTALGDTGSGWIARVGNSDAGPHFDAQAASGARAIAAAAMKVSTG